MKRSPQRQQLRAEERTEEDVVTTPLAEKALGQVAGAVLGTVVDVKLAWDAVTYAYGLATCQ